MSYTLNDTTYTTPVTASFVDDSAMDGHKPNGNGFVLAIIGEANNLEPLVAHKIYNYRQARSVFGTDEPQLLKAFEKAFNPSKDPAINSPSHVIFVNPRAQEIATAVLQNSAATNAINIRARTPGKSGAALAVKLEVGTLANSTKITIFKGNVTAIKDNIKAIAFSIVYAGAETTATAVFVDVSGVRTLRVTLGATVTDLSLDTYVSAQGLVAALNDIAGITATLSKPGAGFIPTSELDGFTVAKVIKTTTQNILNLNAVLARTLTSMSNLIIAERIDGLIGSVGVVSKTPLSYTESVAATLGQWQTALDVLKNEKCQFVVPLTSNSSVFDMVSAHVDYMTNVAFQWRRAIVGMVAGSTIDEAVAQAEIISNKRVSLVHIGFRENDDKGVSTFYHPSVLAALIGGMICGAKPGEPLTNKTINVSDLAVRLKYPEDTDILLQGGVLCCWRDFEGNVKIMQSVTVSQDAENFNRHELSVGVATDYVESELRKTADTLRGKKNTQLHPAIVKSALETRLKQLAAAEPVGEGVLVGDSVHPAWTGLTVAQSVDSITASVQVSPVIPNNYIGIGVYAVPYPGITA